ncbi:type-F conjugative transfer system protein TraW [Testudinibacter sp. TR-2022]|uniref:type-F conjugative transfer system protein TraW n=1 Tax=Testudinibacter sp. TR-2022 TaxID=2585029 RepID=UPI00111ABD2D|nr:type-F conjugative transfer system protein TraW [Testudinibacter sp. TR-2022]TNH04045.1 type-F conjugative transfer system protein TraW [Pasteurellaceae bacterium Phil31]TNH10170.1 type-F conjugative transfer system protein TraW [Testudinibacter sp. TR-2022]TNH13030.1 type-F conjugative transfer system protein TraW [Testudinibacter sp. TR-2022]
MKRTITVTTLIMLLSLQGGAKNLGVAGQVWAIQENNLLSVIDERLKEQFDGKSQAEVQAEVQKRVEENALRPEPVLLPAVKMASERLFDPSYILDRDLADHNGVVFAKKGTVVNPFDITDFNQTLIFIDADNEEQVEWIKQFLVAGRKKIILTKGNIHDADVAIGEQTFFDQGGFLVKRFQIAAVPTVIDQAPEKKVLRIREVLVHEN